MSLHLEIEDNDGDLIEVETEDGAVVLTLNCDELDEYSDGVYAELTPEDAKRLALNLLTAVGYIQAEDAL